MMTITLWQNADKLTVILTSLISRKWSVSLKWICLSLKRNKNVDIICSALSLKKPSWCSCRLLLLFLKHLFTCILINRFFQTFRIFARKHLAQSRNDLTSLNQLLCWGVFILFQASAIKSFTKIVNCF